MINNPLNSKWVLNLLIANIESEATKEAAPIIKKREVFASNFWYCHIALESIMLIVMPYVNTGIFIGPRCGQSKFMSSIK